MGRFVHDCPLLARKLENGLDTKNPRKSMKYKGIMWWPLARFYRRKKLRKTELMFGCASILLRLRLRLNRARELAGLVNSPPQQ